MWKQFTNGGDNMSRDKNPFVNQVLWSNGFTKKEEVFKKLMTDSFTMKLEDSSIFISEINEIIKKNLKVSIVGDYDVDGVCSTAILYKFLENLGIDFDWIIPNRFSDGYGLKETIVDKVIKKGSDVIITVDNGIKAKRAIEYAVNNNIKVLVTDHHHADLEEIPDKASVIINPHYKNDNLVFKDVCGAVVIYSLVFDYFNKMKLNRTELLNEMREIASLATIADVMPLHYGNRFLVKEFVEKVRTEQTINKGINKIIELMKIKRIIFNEDDIGFKIGPLLNAPGRLFSAELGVHILTSSDDKKITEMVEDAILINEERKREVEKAMQLFSLNHEDSVHVVLVEDVSEGIIGIVSGRITEDTSKPSFTFVANGDHLKGSGRSPANYNLIEGATRVLKKHPELTLGFGGHAGAMGITIKDVEALELFKKLINEDYIECNPPQLVRYYIHYDRDSMDLKHLHESVEQLRPFGEGLRPPVFRTEGLIFKIRNFGKTGDNSSFTMKSDKKGYYSNYSYFKTKLDPIKDEKRCKVYFTTSKSYDESREQYFYSGNVVEIED